MGKGDGVISSYRRSVVMGALLLPLLAVGGVLAHAQVTAATGATSPTELQFSTKAPNAILMDARTGKSLFEKEADVPIDPASTSKLMTQIMVYERLADGTLTLDTEFLVSKNAWRKGGARGGGSTMYLEPESRVKLGDLLKGAIIDSGNDACIAIAENIAGTEEAFAGLMTQRAREMGLKANFRNATGLYDPEHKISVRELALLAEYIMRKYPDYYKFYSQTSFTWNNITQQNRNPLLLEYPGADGLKTGYVKEGGYNLVGSAVRNQRRLIMVIAGLPSIGERREEAAKLLDWGFRQFKPFSLYAAGDTVGQVRVWGGTIGTAPLVTKDNVKIALSEEESRQVKVELSYKGPLVAPVSAGTKVGRIRFQLQGKTIAEQPIYTGQDVPATDSTWKRALDSLIIMAIGG